MSKSFMRGSLPVRVLEEVSLEVAAGELFAIYGKRASGKTTLLEIAAGLAEPDTGSVFFAGRNLAELSGRQLAQVLREEIGWVERDGPRTSDVSMRVHVAVPLYRMLARQDADRRALAIMERVGVADYADAFWPDLPDTVRTFVAVAQALVREPRLLVVDDPIYGLAVTEREAVTGLLRDLAENAGVGVLLAVPELPPMLHADQARILAGGRLIGPPSPGGGTVLDFPQPRSA